MPEILLVDDESQVLAGLRRTSPLSGELWTLGWAMDGPGALEYLASHQVDVVVADTRVPGADGATLLEQVRQQFPGTARVVLSDGADRDAIMSAAGAQQFLWKSGDPATLTAALASILAARSLLDDSHLRSLLGSLEALPRPPQIYAELVALAQRPESTVTQFAQLVEQDLATTAELLKLVNSSFFGLSREVTSVQRAVALLGVNVIQTVVLAGQAFRPSRPLPADLAAADLAAQGIRASLAVRRMMSTSGWPEQAVEELSVAALLYDIGLLALAATQPASWATYSKLSSDRPGREAQLAAFGCTLGQAGGYVLGLWGFHANIVNALAEQPIALDDADARASASPAALAVAEAHAAAVTD